MKFFLIIFSFICFAANAQSVDSLNKGSAKSGLSEFELQIAKDDYLKMMQSETYIEMHKEIKTLNKKLKGVKLFDVTNADWIKDMDGFKKALREVLRESITRTDFKSLDEAVDAIVKNFQLMQKNISENSELYVLIAKANREQIAQIMAPERRNPYDILYGY